MVATVASEMTPSGIPNYDRKSFDETKAGVKGLAEAGVTKIPLFFVHPPDSLPKNSDTNKPDFTIPIIDLESVGKDPVHHKEIVEKIRFASGNFGFFQVVNHGIPVIILEEVLDGVRSFYDQDNEVKKEYYTRDPARKVMYNSNINLFTAHALCWRDTLLCSVAPNLPPPEDLPAICRDITIEYTKQVLKLGSSLFGLLSEALGLNPNKLSDMDCDKGLTFAAHCYPACPQPELTLGATKHTDDGFLTVLLQDQIGGLQILHQDQWIDVPPTPGALVINIGDLLQLISNDKFISVQHRVIANHQGPRVSVASFFSTNLMPSSRLYGPIKELLSEDNPPLYKETTAHDYCCFKWLKEAPPLQHLKIPVNQEN